LRYSSVFCDIYSEDLQQIEESKIRKIYTKGEEIFKTGYNSVGIYIIEVGKVKLEIPTKKRTQIVRLAKAGEIIGYRSALFRNQHDTTAIALEKTEVCFINKELFQRLFRKSNGLSLQILQFMNSEIQRYEKNETHFLNKNVKERIAAVLLNLLTKFGVEPVDQTINIQLSRGDLSSLCGTAIETLIRTLADLKSDGVIGLKGKRIRIIKPEVLNNILQ
jgi:CRP/FNR family transcriptional regulator